MVALGLAAFASTAGGQDAAPAAPRPVRIGNVNLITGGVGMVSHDHPTLDDDIYPTIAYSRRVLRREMRHFPLWLRGAFQYLSSDQSFYGYKVWDDPTLDPFPENVDEHTSDVTFRGEAILDVVRLPLATFYGGAGFLLHTLRFSSRGDESTAGATTEASLTATSASLAAGLRVAGESRPYTGYLEARLGRVFGSNAHREAAPGVEVLYTQDFEFTSANAVFLEAGFGFHW